MEINGLRVVDARRPVKLHISARDTRVGNNKAPQSCAAAKACTREVEGCVAARIYLGRAYLQIGDKWLRFKTSQALRAEIIAFDRGGTFEPGVYALSAMSPSERAGVRRSGSNTNRNKGGSVPGKSPRRLLVHRTTAVRERANRHAMA